VLGEPSASADVQRPHGKDALTRIFVVLIFIVVAYVLYRSGQTIMS
jgi:hypothetical protein